MTTHAEQEHAPMSWDVPTGIDRCFTPDEFNAWLLRARPGSQITYAVAQNLPGARGEDLCMGLVARELCDRGLVHLVQRRLSSDNGLFAYIAVKT